MLVDEPEGGDDGYDGKESRHDPPDIMRYDVPYRDTISPSSRTLITHWTYVGIRLCRAGKERVPSVMPWA